MNQNTNKAIGDSSQIRFQRIEPMLDRALELEGEAREAFVRTCCEVHPDLADDLKRALAADAEGLPRLGELADVAARGHTVGRLNLRVGPWRLLERLAAGGMGTVYLAERADGAFDKQVAVKLLRGRDLRFKEQLERERRVMARLEHPSIARLIDGGMLPDGQPYLVMELVGGEDLDSWCYRTKPNLKQRLAVFLKICGAVAYAHGLSVVHRDLKPSNIRIGDDGEVKLLDFGLAKLLEADGTARRGDTRHVALTPAFAAPEQLEDGDVTARTDIYALGALLYLLLTGRSPHPRFDGNWAALIEAVCRQSPVAPSAAATASADSTTPAPVPARALRGDLDAIVLKALAREPAQRYASAEQFAKDIHNYLAWLPVNARAPTVTYRFGCWFRRNWLPTSLGMASFLLLAAIVILMGQQLRLAAAERDEARTALRREAVVRGYVMSLLGETLRTNDLDGTAALQRAETRFSADPATYQAVLLALSDLYIALQAHAAAEATLQRLLQLDLIGGDAVRAQALTNLGLIALRRNDRESACRYAGQVRTLLDSLPETEQLSMIETQWLHAQCAVQ